MVKENETTNVDHDCLANMVITDPRQEGLNIVKGLSVKSIRKYLEENLSISKATISNSEKDWEKFVKKSANKKTSKGTKIDVGRPDTSIGETER